MTSVVRVVGYPGAMGGEGGDPGKRDGRARDPRIGALK